MNRSMLACAVVLLGAAAWAQEDEDRVPVRILAGGRQASEFADSQQIVIQSQDALKELWTRLRKSEFADAPTLPKIDFSKEMVLAVFYGKNRQIQSRIQIVGVQRKDGKTLVFYARAFRGGVDEGFTYPYHIVAIPRYAGDVVFQQVMEPTK